MAKAVCLVVPALHNARQPHIPFPPVPLPSLTPVTITQRRKEKRDTHIKRFQQPLCRWPFFEKECWLDGTGNGRPEVYLFLLWRLSGYTQQHRNSSLQGVENGDREGNSNSNNNNNNNNNACRHARNSLCVVLLLYHIGRYVEEHTHWPIVFPPPTIPAGCWTPDVGVSILVTEFKGRKKMPLLCCVTVNETDNDSLREKKSVWVVFTFGVVIF